MSVFYRVTPVLILCIGFFLNVLTVDAALLYLEPSDSEVFRGDTKTISIRIDTDVEECINTVDAVIKYDPSIRAVDVSRGNSILKLWVEDPVINEAEHTITLAGGIPNGYCGRAPGDPSLTNVIAELVFRSPGFSIGGGESSPIASIWFDEATRVLLNDGFGTEAALRLENAKLTLQSTPGNSISDDWKGEVASDTQPPADFSITLTRDETSFSGDYFISFNSQDKQSGIDHYEVMEEPIDELYTFKWGGVDAPWKPVQSPYVLVDQTLNSTIRVKAIDKAGNETIAVLVPEEAMRTISTDRIITIAVSALIFLLFLSALIYFIIRRKGRIIETYENIA